jgi:hypothetical protein
MAGNLILRYGKVNNSFAACEKAMRVAMFFVGRGGSPAGFRRRGLVYRN